MDNSNNFGISNICWSSNCFTTKSNCIFAASFTKVLNVSNESQDKSASMLVSLNSTNALMLEELKKQTRGGKQMNDALGGAA